MSKFKFTTAFEKILTLKKRLRVIQGGKGCSKTISILQMFILMAISEKNSGLVMSIVAQSLPNLKTGAIRDFESILRDMGIKDKFKVNRTNLTYSFGTNIIEFFSVDGADSRLGSRRSHLYVNEATGITHDTFIELFGRTSVFTICDYNPRREFWIHTEYIGQPNVDFIKLNYKDNEYIPDAELEIIMDFKRRWDETGSKFYENKWRVLGLGELGSTEGVIFEEGVDYDVIDKLPEDAEYIGAGLDFGFSHPTTIIKIYLAQSTYGDDHVILHESLFKAGMTTPMIAMHIKGDVELMSSVIVCDSARPEMIREMRGMRIPVLSHRKGFVMAGIDLMHSLKMYVTGSSENTIEELRSYAYATDRSGKSLGVPNKAADMDNSIDAARYAIEHFLTRSKIKGNGLRWLIA